MPANLLAAAARTLGLALDTIMPVISLAVERRRGQRVELRRVVFDLKTSPNGSLPNRQAAKQRICFILKSIH